MPPVMPLPQTQSHPELNLLLYAPDNRHMARLGSVLAGQANLRWVDSRETNPRQLLDAAAGSAFVLLDYCGGNAAYSTDLARQLHALPGCPAMIGLGTTGPEQAAHLLAAMRAGVCDFVDIDNNTAQMLEVFERVGAAPSPVRAAATPELRPDGRLIVLLGVRPGVGTSTLATHLGVSLAEQNPVSPDVAALQGWLLLIDLGQPAADAALYLGMESHFSYEESLRSVERMDRTFVGTAFAHHASGMALLGIASGSLLKKHEPISLLDRLRSVFPLSLCDVGGLPVQLLPTTLLKSASEVWLVTDQAIGSLVSLDQTMRELESRGLRDDRLQLIVNRFDANGGLADTQIAQRFNLPLLATLPDRSRVLRSNAGLGRLLTDAAPRDPYLKALQPLLQRLDRRRLATPPTTAPASPLARLANLLGR